MDPVTDPAHAMQPRAEPPSLRPPPGSAPAHDIRARGFAAAFAAYFAWGLFPAYFKAIGAVPPLEILAHRVVWSMAFLALLVTARGRWRDRKSVV